MTVDELVQLLQQCEPKARVALVESTGVYALTDLKQSPGLDAVLPSHSCSGFEAELE